MDRGVRRGAGSVLCILLLPEDVVPGSGAMPSRVVAISDKNDEGSIEGQRRVGSRGVMGVLTGALQGIQKQGLTQSFNTCLIISLQFASRLKILRRECHESSTTTDTANLKCNHHKQHSRMANLRCVDIPNPDSPR